MLLGPCSGGQMCQHDIRQCKRSGAPRAAACTAVLLALFTPSQSFSRPCTALRGAGGSGLARARPRAGTAGLAMSGGPKIDPRTGLPEGYEPPKLNKAQEAMIKRVLEQSKNSNKMKRVEFKSSATAAAKVNDTGVGDNATLDTYFNLPAEKWVTLDDRCAHVPPRVLAWACCALHAAPCPRATSPRVSALAAAPAVAREPRRIWPCICRSGLLVRSGSTWCLTLAPHSSHALFSRSLSLSRVRRYISRLDAPDDNRNAVQYRFTLPLKV